MVGRAVAITVESRFCMKKALATIIAVVRVRLVVRTLAGMAVAVWSVISAVSPAATRWGRPAGMSFHQSRGSRDGYGLC